METQKISQDVVSSLNINKIETIAAFQKYINVYAQSQITLLNNTTYQQETFELSSDSLAFLLNDFTLYLQMKMTTGTNLNSHKVFYKNSTGFIKGITIRTGSGQIIYHVEDSIQIIGNSHRLRNSIPHEQEDDQYRSCKFPGDIEIQLQGYINANKQDVNLDLLTTFAVGDAGADVTRDFTLSVSMKKLLPWKQYLKLSDSSIYITVTYNKPNEFLLLKNAANTVLWNQSTFTNVKTMMRCNQQMDLQINQTLKQLYENSMYGFDYYTMKQATIGGDLTSFNYSCQITKNDGQMIKGLIIAVIKDNIESVVNGFCDYHSGSQLTKVQSLQLYFDSQQVENNPFTQKPCGNQLISQQQHVDLWYYDLIQSEKDEDGQQIGGYQFGSAQSYNLNLQLGLRTTVGIQSKLVIFVVGQKYLKQSQNQVMVL